ncbi:MAG TPA: ATP-binding protein, partial [Verrucomicrobiae bacterium]|nr:ATP-binding protein [Verrucomicrobiae bacterium]
MSHEIRTPMNGILGISDLLLKSRLTEKQKSYCRSIVSSAAALLDIINEGLDISRVEAGMMEVESTPFNLHDVCFEVAELLAPKAAPEVDLIVRYHPSLPHRFIGDGGRLRQVLMNLVGNALRHTSAGHVLISVTTPRRVGGKYVVTVSVADTGEGIAEENLRTVFDRFYRVPPPAADRSSGTGLGLAISKKIVETMGGDIRVSSKVGGGSIFWFSLDLLPEEEVSPQVRLIDRRVVVADENPVVRGVAREILELAGAECDEAGSFSDLLTLVAAPDANGLRPAVLVDGALAGLDLESLRGSTGCGPVYLLGRLADDSSMFPLFSQHDGFIGKPFSSRQLLEMLTRESCGARPVASPPDNGDARAGKRFGHLKILIAEDNPSSQMVTRVLVEYLGGRAEVAANGQEAVEMVTSRAYDLVLMDCRMPVLDGFEATGRIRSLDSGRQPVIIALTADALEGDRARCMAAGMDDYLTKPVKSDDLQFALEKWFPADKPSVLPASASFPELFENDRVSELLRIFGGREEEVYRQVYRPFVALAQSVMPHLRAAVGDGRVQDVIEMAHRLKGAAGNVGASLVAAAASRVQSAALAGEAAALRELLKPLEELVEETLRALASLNSPPRPRPAETAAAVPRSSAV